MPAFEAENFFSQGRNIVGYGGVGTASPQAGREGCDRIKLIWGFVVLISATSRLG